MKPAQSPLAGKTPQEQADYWLTLLHSPFAGPEQRQAFRKWLAENPANRAAWEKSRAFWQKTASLNEQQITALEQQLKAPGKAQPAHKRQPLHRFQAWPLPVFACLLLTIWFATGAWPGYFADYRTATGEQRLVQLSDGSSVLLNTESALSVEFSDTSRMVTLHGGEAYFKVAPDAHRPFEVQTETGRVRALGTAFDIKQLGNDMAVTVYEHAVRVTFSQGETVERLNEGERVAANGQHRGPVETVNLKQAQAWRDHRLVFREQRLQQVVAELNRYRPGKIVILDAKLAGHRVTGVFDPREPEAALAVIEKTLSVRAYRLAGRLVFLTRA